MRSMLKSSKRNSDQTQNISFSLKKSTSDGLILKESEEESIQESEDSEGDSEEVRKSLEYMRESSYLKKHIRVRSLSNPPQGDLHLAASLESTFSCTNLMTDQEGVIEEEEGDLGPNIWEEKGQVQMVVTQGKTSVKCGNLNQLLLHFTEASNVANARAEFTDTFMITFQTFMDPYQFVRKLVERYKVPPCPPDQDEETYDSTFKIPIQLRVIQILKKWIKTRFSQDLAPNLQLLSELNLFIDNQVFLDHPEGARNLQNSIAKAMCDNSLERESFLNNYTHQRKESKRSNGSKKNSLETFYPRFESLISFDVRELAAQMTLLDIKYFKTILLSELNGQAWNKNKKKSPNVLRCINHTNVVSNWVVHSILSEETPKQRAKIMTNFINLLSSLNSYRNFAGIMGVLSGLNSSSITRLKNTLKEVPGKVLKIQLAFAEMMRTISSFKNYRLALRSSDAPAVPFLGVTLSDLTFIEDGNPDFLEEGIINWQKRTLLARILTEFTDDQLHCKYTIEETEMLSSFVRRLDNFQDVSEDLYEISLQLEPRKP